MLGGLVKRVVVCAFALIVIFFAGSLATNLNVFRNLLDPFLNQKTYVATGDVVLKKLKAQETFVAATGSFEVPVVVCNGTPESFDLRGKPDEDGRTPAQRLLEHCDGRLDAKATVLASVEVDAVIDLRKLAADDIDVSGEVAIIRLPPIVMEEPRVDAERGIAVLAKKGSVPWIGGRLPDDYQAQAAGAGKDAVGQVAVQSGLLERGERSAQSFFEGLLSMLGFTDMRVSFQTAPPPRL